MQKPRRQAQRRQTQTASSHTHHSDAEAAAKDYLLDHLECALMLAQQRGARMTGMLITLAIRALDDWRSCRHGGGPRGASRSVA